MRTSAIFIIALLLLLAPDGAALKAQDLTEGSIYRKDNINNRKPVPLPHLREADIVWSKMIWRMVDLREKMNHPLYFPTEPFGPRMSLIDVLYKAVESGEIIVYPNEEFRSGSELSIEVVRSNLGAEATTQTVIDVNTGESVSVDIPGEARTFEVLRYLILEQWYFDKQNSRFGSRIIGLAPIRVWQRRDETGDDEEGETLQRQVFWVHYPSAREVLARHEVFTMNNDLSNLSFDDLLLQRRFSGYIYRESNVFDNRAISDYATGRDALYESERIQNMIFNFEQDLWEY